MLSATTTWLTLYYCDNFYDDENGGVLLSYDYGDASSSFTYDSLNRVKYEVFDKSTSLSNVYNWYKRYTYAAGASTDQTTNLVSKLNYDFISGTDHAFNYSYDNLGNISAITETVGGTTNEVAEFRYDEQGQLKAEEVSEEAYTMLYRYDTYGNILTAEKYMLYLKKYSMSFLSLLLLSITLRLRTTILIMSAKTVFLYIICVHHNMVIPFQQLSPHKVMF